MISELTRPVRRRIGRLVVSITASGITLRGYKQRRSMILTWEQIASLASSESEPVLAMDETNIGHKKLQKLKADPNAPVKKAEK